MFGVHVSSWMTNGFMDCSEKIEAKYLQVVNKREFMLQLNYLQTEKRVTKERDKVKDTEIK